ncbi:efflux RND transporter periplasmic adaptor subunit [Ulvibacter antarcticus]|uniref:HlyD family secretion protein n=1 Tax=Ulvibacter antarcticus TaxID=442714 RepID=A0A3L9YUP8_9FLAO|nr:HlyD family efflux transporter periplasmic adaptor subunit [Ulvibacter antarcticus]RMA64386.1 HlyD family secretion protein [Ulvibacter antarcticus]
MDKQLKPKNKNNKKMLIGGTIFILLLLMTVYNFTRKRQVNLDNDTLAIREVKKADFEDVILFNSQVEPKTSVLINVVQGGAVSEIFVESGQMVNKGTPLLKIYNPNAELSYLTQETAIVEQINNLRNIRVNIKSQQLNLTEQLLSIDNSYKNAKRQYVTDTTLYRKDVIAKNDYKASVQEYEYQSERNEAIKKSVSREKGDRSVQLSRIDVSIQNMQKSLELLHKNKENFTLKAPIDGMLSSFNPNLGENYIQGQSVGKIAVLDGYKLVAKVDEFYISKLVEGTKGIVNVGSESYEISVSKIFPEVVSGQFEVELTFDEEVLNNTIKGGMSLQTKLFLSNSQQALLISKGMFYQSTHGKWVFVLDSENKAVKRNIKLGRENPFYYEIMDGLQEGDKVIISSYDDFLDVEEITIN